MDWTAEEGSPFPLGTTWIESARAWNFALYSKHAESVTLLLYAEADLVNPVFTFRLDYLKNKSGRTWHCRVACGRPPRGSLLRLLGCRARSQRPLRAARLRSGKDPPRSLRQVDLRPPGLRANGGHASRVECGQGAAGVARRPARSFDWGDDKRPRHESDTIICELHVRGFTNNPNSGVSPAAARHLRGIDRQDSLPEGSGRHRRGPASWARP